MGFYVWSLSLAQAHKTQPRMVMQAKAKEPSVSIEEFFSMSARFVLAGAVRDGLFHNYYSNLLAHSRF
jgi:hypothetical protein